MLDLSVYEQKSWEVKLLDGRIIHVLKPDILMLIEIERFEKAKNSKTNKLENISKSLVSMTQRILNENEEGISLTIADIKKLGFQLQLAVINGYQTFIREVMDNPNSKSPMSQNGKTM